MNCVNAIKGIKKIILAQFFAIITALLTSGTALLLSLCLWLSKDVYSIVATPLGKAGIGLGLISMISVVLTAVISFIGYIQASKDEAEFRKSMICTLIMGALTLIGTFFKIPNGFISTILNSAGTVFEMFVMIFAISGAVKLLEKTEETALAERGDKVLDILVVTYIITLIFSLIIRIFELSSNIKNVSIIIGAVSLGISIFQYVVFIKYFKQTLNALKKTENRE
ncbi:MAG: hypothetical protein IIU39_05260 [Ruminococcus sp.]|nr:hypothetical protein [Ruminococcus sp.]